MASSPSVVTAMIGTSSAGQGHETLVATVVAEELERDPDDIRVIHSDSVTALPSNSPVGSRMAIMMGGAATGAAARIKARLLEIAGHNLQLPVDRLVYSGGNVAVRGDPGKAMEWSELVDIAHRRYHQTPLVAEPG